MGTIISFEDLEVWRMARSLRRSAYVTAALLPDIERFNLGSQIRSSGISLTANLAEGFGRFHFRENIQFCRVSRGSAFELLDHFIACCDQGFISAEQLALFRRDLAVFLKLLNGYIRSIDKTRRLIIPNDQ